MRKYLFGTGIISAVGSGFTLLREQRDEQRFTWRVGLAWVSWGITLALAIGAIRDKRRESKGLEVLDDGPLGKQTEKLLKQHGK